MNEIINKKVCNFHIRMAMDHIEKNYSEPLTLDDMAKYLNLNKCYFSDLFKRETGKTYSRFLNEFRIKKSKILLENTNLSVLEVALAVGYNNQNYFNMIFKKLTNTTPLKYRNENFRKCICF
ncbi:MAG: helix-turn-helix transcriptional regulator [Clostridiales bacterium]|nr:helix-turn-helix transcriptional regulator [Clostridiales bacterium]